MDGLELMGLGNALPARLVTNEELSHMVDTSDEWITTRTGIATRYWAVDETNVSLATDAAVQAMSSAGVTNGDISLVVVATFSTDQLTPSVACQVAGKLGLSGNVMCLDINAACSGFIYALATARGLLLAQGGQTALVIGSETLSRITDMTDRNTCVLFGDAAGAAVVRLSASHAFNFVAGCSPDNTTLCCDSYSRTIQMDGKAVFRFAVDIVPHCVVDVLAQAGLTIADVDYVVCHQANRRIIEAAAKRLGLPMDKFIVNLQHYGNTSSASIPLALCELPTRRGDRVICVGFGAGLTYGAVLITI